jgi:hypothetical protein
MITVKLTRTDCDDWDATLMNGDQEVSVYGVIPLGQGGTIPEALIELAQDIREKAIMEIEDALFGEKTPD